jgi:hypothetical protein
MRKTKNDIKKLQVAGFYKDVELGEPAQVHTDVEKKKADEQGYSLTDDDRYQIYEIQIDYNLPGYEDEDEIALPYIISIDKGTNKVLSIYRNWEEKTLSKLSVNILSSTIMYPALVLMALVSYTYWWLCPGRYISY